MTRYAWSIDGETYHGDCASVADAVTAAKLSADWDDRYPVAIKVGVRVEPAEVVGRVFTIFDVDQLVERLNEDMAEEMGGEDQVYELDSAQEDELRALVVGFFRRQKTSWFAVKDEVIAWQP